MGEIHDRARIAHEERQFLLRQVAIDADLIPPTRGGIYEASARTRLEWARDMFELFDYLGVIDQADKVLAIAVTPEEREEAERLRGRAERAYARFGDMLVKAAPVEPTWRGSVVPGLIQRG